MFPVDKTMNKILNEAETHFKGRFTREQIKEVFHLLFLNIADAMRGYDFPTITIPKFAKLKPKIKEIGFFAEKLSKLEGREEDCEKVKLTLQKYKNQKCQESKEQN